MLISFSGVSMAGLVIIGAAVAVFVYLKRKKTHIRDESIQLSSLPNQE